MDDRFRAALKMKYIAVFQADILNERLVNIQKLYDAAHITNDMLLNQLNKHTANMTDLKKAVFNDIAFILAEELVENEELVSIFDSLYYKQYKDIYDGIKAAGDVIVKDYDKGMALLGKLARKVMRYSGYGRVDTDRMMDIQKTSEFRMMSLLNMRNQNLLEAGSINEKAIIEEEQNWRKREAGSSELYLNDERIVFTDDEKPVFQSKMFEKFVERQKKALADYLKIKPQEMASYFEKVFDNDLRREDLTYLPASGDAGISNMATIHVVQSNYGGSQWFHTITSPKGVRKGSVGYHPDFEKIADAYYRARVFVKYIEIVNSDNDFIKSTLSRECKSENPRDDYLALLYLYNVDIVYQMFKVMQEMYYRNFSWENISGQSPLSRSNQIIQDLREIISNKERAVTDLNRRLTVMNSVNNKVVQYEQVNELREKNRLLDIIEQKEQEIVGLKERIRYQNELIDAFNTPEEMSENVVVNIEELQTKRYLFVGHTEEDFPELNHTLRKTFPDSIFMRAETDSIDKIEVDAVVVFLNWTSHGMYYKVKANNVLKHLPTVYCKTKNINRIYQEIQDILFE